MLRKSETKLIFLLISGGFGVSNLLRWFARWEKLEDGQCEELLEEQQGGQGEPLQQWEEFLEKLQRWKLCPYCCVFQTFAKEQGDHDVECNMYNNILFLLLFTSHMNHCCFRQLPACPPWWTRRTTTPLQRGWRRPGGKRRRLSKTLARISSARGSRSETRVKLHGFWGGDKKPFAYIF